MTGFEVGFDFRGCCPELVKLVKLIKFVKKYILMLGSALSHG